MALYRRGKSKIWYVKFTKPDGSPCRQSTGTENKQLATEYHDKLKASLWNESRLGIKQDKPFTEMVDLFLQDRRKKGRSPSTIEAYEQQLDWWSEKFKGKTVRQITQDLIVNAIAPLEESRSNATCNRYLAALHGVLTLAKDKYTLIDVMPAFFKNPEPKCRVRYLKPDEITRLIEALPEELRDVASFSFATGFRQENAVRLRWDEVDLVNKVVVLQGERMKNGKTFGVPLSQAAIDILRRQIGKHHEYVFTYQGKPRMGIGSNTWKRAKEKAGIEDFRWHDIRHTWASMLAQAGVPDNALMALGSWETPSMVRKYAHLSTDSVRQHAEALDSVLGNTLPKPENSPEAQFGTHPPQKGLLKLVA